MKIRHRHLRRRHEKQFPILQSVHVGFEFRQLRRADHAIAADQKRRTDFKVAVFACMQIEHEIDERAFQLCARTGEADEPAAANFRRAFQIEKSPLFPERDVIESFL